MYNGLINVYKESGFTSFDVVAKLRGILKQKKIGHTGTLDPQAKGVLLVCLGDGTKLTDMLEDRSKEYICKMLLGQETDTEDTTGTVLKTYDINVTKCEITKAVNSFVGDYYQIPPMYSALKINGHKMYELARKGIQVERKARLVHIDSITINSIELPYVTFTVSCSKGSYIRSLCRDIGNKLGCGGTMEHLTRTRVGQFKLDTALKLNEIEDLAINNMLDKYILPLEDVFNDCPSLYVKEKSAKYIDNGNPLSLDDLYNNYELIPEENVRYKIYNTDKHFVAIYNYLPEKNLFVPEKMFPNLMNSNS